MLLFVFNFENYNIHLGFVTKKYNQDVSLKVSISSYPWLERQMKNSGWFCYLCPEQTEALQWAWESRVSGRLLIPVSTLITAACSKVSMSAWPCYGKPPSMRPDCWVHKVNFTLHLSLWSLPSSRLRTSYSLHSLYGLYDVISKEEFPLIKYLISIEIRYHN